VSTKCPQSAMGLSTSNPHPASAHTRVKLWAALPYASVRNQACELLQCDFAAPALPLVFAEGDRSPFRINVSILLRYY
jgi:hypothetical protein